MKQHWKLLLFILAVTFAALFPSLRNGFTNLDDARLVYQNPYIMSLSAENLRHIFVSFHYFLYTPLVLLSHALEHALFGLNPFAYHAVNLGLHLANTALAYALVLLLTRSRAAAAAAALLFGVHPLHVESVAWVSERKDVLYGLFFLSSLILYARYLQDGAKRLYLGSLALFLCSLLSKPMALTLPFALFLLDFARGRRLDRRALLDKLPFFALFLAGFAVSLAGSRGLVEAVEPAITLGDHLKNVMAAHYALLFYLDKLVWPARLTPVYPLLVFPGDIPLSLYLSTALVWAFIVLAFVSLRSTRAVFFGVFFFLVTLLPATGRIAAGHGMVVADRYTYLPSLGLFLLAGLAFARLFSTARSRAVRLALAALAVLVTGALSARAWQQCRIWGDDVLLWSRVLEQYPPGVRDPDGTLGLAQRYPNAPVAFKYRGYAYLARGDRDSALRDAEAALLLSPGYDDALLLRGNLNAARGAFEAAREDFALARSREAAYAGLAMVALREKNDMEALDWASRAVEENPESAQGYLLRGKALAALGKSDRALRDLDRAAALAPYLADAYLSRGCLALQRGDLSQAERDYHATLRLEPRNAEALNGRGTVYAQTGRPAQALADLTAALEADPGSAGAWLNLGTLRGASGEYAQAVEAYSRALSLDPSCAPALAGRSAAFLLLGDLPRAKADAQKARALGAALPPDLLKDIDAASNTKR